MRSLATQAILALTLIGSAASPALADHDVFLGWSADSSYFVKAGQRKQKDRSLSFCSEEAQPAWPKELGTSPRKPIFGSPGPCAFVRLTETPITVDKARELVKARAARKGPKGQTITLKFKDKGDGESQVIAVLTAGKMKIERETDFEVVNENQRPTTKLTEVFWRPDGKQVAFYIDTNPADTDSERWTYVWNVAKDLETAEQVTKAGKAK